MPQDGIRIPCSALAESSPGRKSWATYMGLTSPRDNSRSSIPPRGDMFSAAIRISQSSLPRTGVLGYSQPSLAGLKPEPAVLTQTLKPLRYCFVLGRDSFIRVPALIASWNVSQALKHHEPPLPRETNVLICSFRSAWKPEHRVAPAQQAVCDRVEDLIIDSVARAL